MRLLLTLDGVPEGNLQKGLQAAMAVTVASARKETTRFVTVIGRKG